MPRLKDSKRKEAKKSLIPKGKYVTYPDPKQSITSVKLTESCDKEIKNFSKIKSDRKVKLTVANGDLFICIPKTTEGYHKFRLKKNMVSNQLAKGCLQSFKLGYSSSAHPHLYCFGAVQSIFKVTANQDSFTNFRKNQNRVKEKESKVVTKLIEIDSIKNPAKKQKSVINHTNKRKKSQKNSPSLNEKIAIFKEKQKHLSEGPPVKKQKMRKSQSFIHKKFDKGKALILFNDPIRYIVAHLLFLKPLSYNEISKKLSEVVGGAHNKKLSKILLALSTKEQSSQGVELYKLKVSFNTSINSNWLGYTPEEREIAYDMIHKTSPMSFSDSEINEQSSSNNVEEANKIKTQAKSKMSTLEVPISLKEGNLTTVHNVNHNSKQELESNVSKTPQNISAKCDLLEPTLFTNSSKLNSELIPNKVSDEEFLIKDKFNSLSKNDDKSSNNSPNLITEHPANDTNKIGVSAKIQKNNLENQKLNLNSKDTSDCVITKSIKKTLINQSKDMDLKLDLKTKQKQTINECSMKNDLISRYILDDNMDHPNLASKKEKESIDNIRQNSRKNSKSNDLKLLSHTTQPATAEINVTLSFNSKSNSKPSNEQILQKSSYEKKANKNCLKSFSENDFVSSVRIQTLSTEQPDNGKNKINKNKIVTNVNSNQKLMSLELTGLKNTKELDKNSENESSDHNLSSNHLVLKRSAAQMLAINIRLMQQSYYSSSTEDFIRSFPKINSDEDKDKVFKFFQKMYLKYNDVCDLIRHKVNEEEKIVRNYKNSGKGKIMELWEIKSKRIKQYKDKADSMYKKLQHIKSIYRKYEKLEKQMKVK